MFRQIWTYGKKQTKERLKVKEWTNYHDLRDTASWLGSLAKKVFDTKASNQQQEFAQAMAHFRMDEATLQRRMQWFRQLTWFYLVCFIAMLVYCHWFLYAESGSVLITAAGYCVSLLLLVQAFRFSYWHCQMAKRKLGCSVLDWFQWLIKVRS